MKRNKKAEEKSEELREDREKKQINIRNNDFLKWQKSLAAIFHTGSEKVIVLTVTGFLL